MIIKNKIKKSRLVNFIIGIIAFISSYFVYIYSYNIQGYELYYLVPLTFGILLFMLPNISFCKIYNIGPFILNITMIIRYIALPLIGSIGKHISILGIMPSYNQLKWAVIYTLYEMIVICILINYLEYKDNLKIRYIDAGKSTTDNYYLYFLLIILAIIVIAVIPETVSDYRFIFDQNELAGNIIVDFPLSGILKTVVNFARYVLVLIVINICYKKNMKRKNYINIFISFLAILLNSVYISNLSRISMLVPVLTFSILLVIIYDDKKERKLILRNLAIVFGVALVYLSFLKFFGEGRGSVNNSTSIKWWGDTLNTYFSGVKETAIGIKTTTLINQIYGDFRFKLLINDIFSEVIGLSNFTVSNLNSTYLYNIIYFGSDISISQIVPNICDGIYYFSGLFAPIWTCVFVYLSFLFNKRIYQNSLIDIKFVYIYASLYCGMVLMINSSMIISNLINVSLLLYILILINRKIIYKK